MENFAPSIVWARDRPFARRRDREIVTRSTSSGREAMGAHEGEDGIERVMVDAQQAWSLK